MKEEFQVRLDSPTIHPHLVAASDLADLLRDWERAIEAEADLEAPSNFPSEGLGDEPFISLVSVRDECASYGFSIGPRPDAFGATARLVNGLAVGGEEWASVAPAAQEVITRAINRFTSQGVSFSILSNVPKISSVTFSPGKPPPQVDRGLFSDGQTSRSVKVVKAGGAKPGAKVELLGPGYSVSVTGSKPRIQELGRLLYKKAIITGNATWRLKDWKMIRLRVDRVESYPEDDVGDVLRKMSGLSGDTLEKLGGIAGFLAESQDDEPGP